eukprot:10833572-Alexandrium_andersonii.AAC.1
MAPLRWHLCLLVAIAIAIARIESAVSWGVAHSAALTTQGVADYAANEQCGLTAQLYGDGRGQ